MYFIETLLAHYGPTRTEALQNIITLMTMKTTLNSDDE